MKIIEVIDNGTNFTPEEMSHIRGGIRSASGEDTTANTNNAIGCDCSGTGDNTNDSMFCSCSDEEPKDD